MDHVSVVDNKDKQKIRMNSFFMALATYGVVAIETLIIMQLSLGKMPSWAFNTLISCGILINVVFFFLFKSGMNQRFSDPSLTLAQIIVSALWGAIPMYFFYDERILCQMFYLPAFSFGMLKLSLKQYLYAVCIIMGIYGLVICIDAASGRSTFSMKVELFQATIFLLILIWLACYGGFISNLRRTLRKQYVELQAGQELIKIQATTDELTSLRNRRYALNIINHLKNVNDTLGHDIGDEVLYQFGNNISQLLRAEDVISVNVEETLLARYGGEEFLLVLPDTDIQQAELCLTRIQSAMNELFFTKENIKVTFSGGVAQYKANETIDNLLKRIDVAMYQAKKEGRNRVVKAA